MSSGAQSDQRNLWELEKLVRDISLDKWDLLQATIVYWHCTILDYDPG